MSVKEHACTKHTNDANGNLILRYESVTPACPLCAALEAEKPEGDWVDAGDLETANHKIAELTELAVSKDTAIDSLQVVIKNLEEERPEIPVLVEEAKIREIHISSLEDLVKALEDESAEKTLQIEELTKPE